MKEEKTKNLIFRRPWGRGFRYTYINDQDEVSMQLKEWIKSLAIPPAWSEVFIDPDQKAKVHAWGRDSKNKKQYIYNQSWRRKREEAKFDRIIEFAGQLPRLRKTTANHLNSENLDRNKVLACMVRLMDKAFFRPGNPKYSEENNSYGLTTIRAKHLDIKDDVIKFHYTGKSGKKQHRVVKSKKLAKVVKETDKLQGYEVFEYIDENGDIQKATPEELNEYIRGIIGDEFSSKDFRTWAGTVLMAKVLSELEESNQTIVKQKNILKATEQVARALGNTKSIAKSSYIDPRITKHYENGLTIKPLIQEVTAQLKDKTLFSAEEKAVVKLLKEKIKDRH